MRHTRLIGTDPHATTVQRRCCATCRTPIYDKRMIRSKDGAKFMCSSCGVPVKTFLAVPDDYHQVHATESQNHKFSRVPAAVFLDHGVDEVEARAARARSRDPVAQAWFEFAHDDTWLRTERFAKLHIICVRFVSHLLPVEAVEASLDVFARAGQDHVAASNSFTWVIREALDMLRINQPGPPGIRRKAFSSRFGLDSKSVKSYTRVYTDATGARMGRKYSPPLAVLLTEIEQAVKSIETRI